MALVVDFHCQSSQRVLAEILARFLKARVPAADILCVVFHKGCPRLAHKDHIGLCVPSQLIVVIAGAEEKGDKMVITLPGIFREDAASCRTIRCFTQRIAAVDLDSVGVKTTPLAGCLPRRQPGPTRSSIGDPSVNLLGLVGRIRDEGFLLHHAGCVVASIRTGAARLLRDEGCILHLAVAVVGSPCSGATRRGFINSHASAIRCISSVFRRAVMWWSELPVLRRLVVHPILNRWSVEDAAVLLEQLEPRERRAFSRRWRRRYDSPILPYLRIRR